MPVVSVIALFLIWNVIREVRRQNAQSLNTFCHLRPPVNAEEREQMRPRMEERVAYFQGELDRQRQELKSYRESQDSNPYDVELKEEMMAWAAHNLGKVQRLQKKFFPQSQPQH